MSKREGLYGLLIFYNVSLLFVALYAFFTNRRSVKEGVNWIKTHYLSGKEFHSGVLFMTIFSTLYSGYSVVAVPAEAATFGFTALRWCGGVTTLLLGSLVLWPRLRPISVAREYYSPGHFIMDRFNSRTLSFLTIFIQVMPQVIYLSVQVASLKNTIDAVTDREINGQYAAVAFSLVILFYEVLGGLKSVAYTDVIVQSMIMITSFVLIGPTLTHLFGGFQGIMDKDCQNQYTDDDGNLRGCVALEKPELLESPTRSEGDAIFSFMLLMFAFPLNPHLMQRCYAAASDNALRSAVAMMFPSSYLTLIPSILIGLTRVAVYPDIPGSTFGVMMARLLDAGWFSYLVSSMSMTASVAAIMSTADSALIGATNSLTVELFKGFMHPSASQGHIVGVGVFFSAFLMGIALSWGLDESIDLLKMINWQNAILSQCLPSFVLGLYWKKASSRALIPGIMAGFGVITLVEFGYLNSGVETYTNSGVWALCTNVAVTMFLQLYLDPEFLDDMERKYDCFDNLEFGPSKLSIDGINVYMKGAKDPLDTRSGVIALTAGAVFLVLSVPYWGIPSTLYFGLPLWALIMIIFQVSALCCGLVALSTWHPCNVSLNKFPSFQQSELGDFELSENGSHSVDGHNVEANFVMSDESDDDSSIVFAS